jgi:hypothetical protein
LAITRSENVVTLFTSSGRVSGTDLVSHCSTSFVPHVPKMYSNVPTQVLDVPTCSRCSVKKSMHASGKKLKTPYIYILEFTLFRRVYICVFWNTGTYTHAGTYLATFFRSPTFSLFFPSTLIFKTRNIRNMWNIKYLRRNIRVHFRNMWNIPDLSNTYRTKPLRYRQ